MPSPIEFRIIESQSTFLDPRKGFEQTTERFQVRTDPLTGRTGHFSHFGAIKPQKLDLGRYLSPEVKGYCPFCGDQRDRATPRFTGDIVAEGRLQRGEALLVPNLFPYDIHSAILIMTTDHVVPLDAFEETRLRDAFGLGIGFLKRLRAVEPSLPYHMMAWNYMPPSGGGLVHPHQQYFATAQPGNQFLDELRASESFWSKHGTSYWGALIEEEQRLDERYVGRIGSSQWLTPFVSFSLLGDVLAIFPEKFSIDDFTEQDIDALVSGLSRLFRLYLDRGIFSFNAAWFFGPAGQRFCPTRFRIAPRTFLNTRDHAPDINFFQALLAEPVSVVLPEDLCRQLKPYFG